MHKYYIFFNCFKLCKLLLNSALRKETWLTREGEYSYHDRFRFGKETFQMSQIYDHKRFKELLDQQEITVEYSIKVF